MCSVRDVCELIKSVKEISLVWNGGLHPFDPNDEVQLGAFGDYAVKEIGVYDGSSIEIAIAFAPIKVS